MELVDVIDKTLSGLLTSRQNVEDSKAEALELLKQDNALEEHNKPLRNTLLRILSSKTDSKSRGESVDDKNSAFFISLNRLKFQLKTPVKTLKSNYLIYILDELKKDIDSKNYFQIEKHMAMVVSQCIYQGWSAKGLLLLSKLFEGANTLEEKWSCFSEKIKMNTENQYEIYYSIKMETRKGITAERIRGVITSLGLNLKKGNQIIDENAERQNLWFLGIALGVVGLVMLLAFFIKRVNFFEISFAGGGVRFKTNMYSQQEIRDFQKQQRLSKDEAKNTQRTMAQAVVQSVPMQPGFTSTGNSIQQLKKASELLMRGVVTQEEFNKLKSSILNQ